MTNGTSALKKHRHGSRRNDLIKHKITARHSGICPADRLPIALIKQAVTAALNFEGVDMPCEVSVLITDSNSIQAINNEYRGIDKPTDVLSFPMFEFLPPGWADPGPGALDPETGLVPLGEIVLSAEKVKEQAEEFSQPVSCEACYLTVHSVLHLLGYDHLDEAEQKKEMRRREKLIMDMIGDAI